jgi:hypothetical protein
MRLWVSKAELLRVSSGVLDLEVAHIRIAHYITKDGNIQVEKMMIILSLIVDKDVNPVVNVVVKIADFSATDIVIQLS